ncbi:hypothetical protein AALP_AAs44053U000300 [Arabis alpina]|uniref:Bidirectional sugar transporter SWEET n=1 Tax=Arabis alpina TaxID=50452 RepID=A0A087FXR0_ARAAL|nr:hypothetical protein AALP_AAs44053U000300 [Arabis alpina]
MLSCALWVLYGMPMVTPNSLLVVTINVTGLTIEIFYLLIFSYFSPTPRKVKLGLWLIVEMVFVGIVATCTLLLFHTHDQRSAFVGIFCVIFVSLMYIAPLTIMRKVIKTKSVKYMPFTLSLGNFLNGVIWVLYARLKFDIFMLIGNGLGTISGAVQLIVYVCYYKTTPKDDDEQDENLSMANSQLQFSGIHGTS